MINVEFSIILLPAKLIVMIIKIILFCFLLFSGLIYMVLFITGCKHVNDRPDISTITFEIKAHRFEKDMFGLDSLNFEKEFNNLKMKYGNFFNLFSFQITSIGSPDSSLMIDHYRSFINDSNFRNIYLDCEKLYGNFNKKNADFTEAFRYYSFYFPQKTIPRVVTMISGFSYPVVCDSTTLGISLDMYLGPSYRFYSTLEPALPNYLRSRMQGDYMVSDAMKGWAESDYGIDESTARMVDFMISQGRLLYYLDKILPDVSDTIKTGYSLSQLEWCKVNEKKIWSFFIENKLLFSFDPNLMNKYVNDGPTTNGFPKESPGNIGKFIGWQIVKSFMAGHKEISLEQLMNEKNLQKIFDESKYKPLK